MSTSMRSLAAPGVWDISVIWVILAAGCQVPNQYQEPPPPKVTVARPVQQTVTHYLEETGTTEAAKYVEIRARVKGYLQTIEFDPGQEVAEGDLLYTIDPQLYEATRDQRKAAVDVAKAEYENAVAQLNRAKVLVPKGAMTREEYDERLAAGKVAYASIAASEAALDEAELDLGYTKITAPFHGRVGKTLVYEGALVGATDATHLTTVVQYDPIYANFSISEIDLLRLRAAYPATKEERQERRENVLIELRRATDQGYPFAGKLDYADLAVDQSTGTYKVRAEFPNPDGEIIPGLFVGVRVALGEQENALLVPEAAVSMDQAGKYLLAVDGENKVQRLDVTVGRKVAHMVVIEEGLTADARVITEGLQRARPGAEVDPEETRLEPPPPDRPPAIPEAAPASASPEPAESSEPAERGEPAESGEPAGPVEVVEPGAPAEPGESLEPAMPGDSSEPAEPDGGPFDDPGSTPVPDGLDLSPIAPPPAPPVAPPAEARDPFSHP